MKRIIIFSLLCLLLIASSVVTACGGKKGEVTQIRYLGAPVGSDNFMVGALFANRATTEMGMPAGAFPGGSAENIKLINAGEAELGYAATMDAFYAYNGLAPFDKKYDKIRFLARHTTVNLLFAVRSDSDIKSIPDLLKGKKVAIGTGGSMAETYALLVMESGYGIKPADIEKGGGVVAKLSYSEMGSGLADKTLDCVCLFGADTSVASKLMAADERWGVRICGVSNEAMAKISAQYPFITKGQVNGGVYKGNPDAVQCAVLNGIQMTNTDIPEDVVYKIMDVLWSDALQKEIQERCPAFPDYQLKLCLWNSYDVIPVHPGAARWYKDKGMALPQGAKVG